MVCDKVLSFHGDAAHCQEAAQERLQQLDLQGVSQGVPSNS